MSIRKLIRKEYEVDDFYYLLQTLNKNMSILKRFAISSAITFIATFAVVFCLGIQDSSFTFSTVSLASLSIAGLTAAARAVAKLVVEFATGYLAK